MATKLYHDTETTTAHSPAGSPRAAGEVVRMPLPGQDSAEPAPKRYPGAVRVAILVGGAVACWAVVAGLASLAL